MSTKPYHYEIQPNGDWHYFVDGQRVEHRQYVAATMAWEREHAQEDTRGEKAKGVYIAKQFRDGVYHPQLAIHPKQKDNGDPRARYTSFRDLERKAAALGMNCNNESH